MPYLDKKEGQVRAAIEYLENRITGEALVEALNNAVETGRRSGKIRNVLMPWTKREGISSGRSLAGKSAWKWKGKITPSLLSDIKKEREELGLTFRKLGQVHGMSYTTVKHLLDKA